MQIYVAIKNPCPYSVTSFHVTKLFSTVPKVYHGSKPSPYAELLKQLAQGVSCRLTCLLIPRRERDVRFQPTWIPVWLSENIFDISPVRFQPTIRSLAARVFWQIRGHLTLPIKATKDKMVKLYSKLQSTIYKVTHKNTDILLMAIGND